MFVIVNGNAPTFHYAAGIDPGLASGGFVVLDRAQDEPRVAVAFSFVEKRTAISAAKAEADRIADRLGGWSDKEFVAAHIRGRAWMTQFVSALDAFEAEFGEIDVFGVESFVDQKQHAKKMMANRWQAPYLMGLLEVELERRGVTVENGRLIYQNAGTVLTQTRAERAELQAGDAVAREAVIPGGALITNEHKRSALSHALAVSLRIPSYTPTTSASALTAVPAIA